MTKMPQNNMTKPHQNKMPRHNMTKMPWNTMTTIMLRNNLTNSLSEATLVD